MEDLGAKRALLAAKGVKPFDTFLQEINRDIRKVPRYDEFTGEKFVTEEEEIVFLQSLASVLGIDVDITRRVIEPDPIPEPDAIPPS